MSFCVEALEVLCHLNELPPEEYSPVRARVVKVVNCLDMVVDIVNHNIIQKGKF